MYKCHTIPHLAPQRWARHLQSVTRMSDNRWRTKRIEINMRKRLDFKTKKKYTK
jgi:hypothetical protein